jgi:hypothetical protein
MQNSRRVLLHGLYISFLFNTSEQSAIARSEGVVETLVRTSVSGEDYTEIHLFVGAQVLFRDVEDDVELALLVDEGGARRYGVRGVHKVVVHVQSGVEAAAEFLAGGAVFSRELHVIYTLVGRGVFAKY